jgi:hypothetical protein
MVKCIFPYTHANKTQEFNLKMNVASINLEANMGMNVSIHLHYGRMIFFSFMYCMDEKKLHNAYFY